MKYEDYLTEIENDPEYIVGQEALRLRFALGDAVMSGRYKRGWSQTELARRVGTKQANISRIEAGIANPTIDLVKKIIDVLELDFNIIPRQVATISTKTVYMADQNVVNSIPVSNWPTISASRSQNNWSSC